MKSRHGKIIVKLNKQSRLFAEFLEDGKSNTLPISWYKPNGIEENGIECTWVSDNNVNTLLNKDGTQFFPLAEIASEGQQAIMTTDSYSRHKTCLPGFIKSILPTDIDNFNLKINKAARYDHENEGDHTSDSKFLFIRATKGKLDFLIKANFGTFNDSNLNALSVRLKTIAENLGLQVDSFNLSSPQSGVNRMVVGLGNESVYENSMTLHHIYGIPYIPGSAIKGITRSWIITECFGSNEDLAKEDSLFSFLFGEGGDGEKGGHKGHVCFFDSFPTRVPKIEPDIMNNHYQSYYEGGTPPADWINPNPVFFLTVRNGKYCFQIGVKKSGNLSPESLKATGLIEKDDSGIYQNSDWGINLNKTNDILYITTAWLKSALEHHGIGAKTAIGYGMMK